MNKEARARMAMDTVAICENKCYFHNNEKVNIAFGASVYYAPDEDIVLKSPLYVYPRDIVVNDKTTFDAAKPYVDRGKRVCMMNFASAKHAGGGFQRGAQAQEECLARASGLYQTLKNHKDFYREGKETSPVYTDGVIYSSNVPVFKDDWGNTLPEPWHADMITCAAPNTTEIKGKGLNVDVEAIFAKRIERMLKVAAYERPDVLVLGAWGCGVFGNDPTMVARLFRKVLDGRFSGWFETVVFGVPFHDGNLNAFRKEFC